MKQTHGIAFWLVVLLAIFPTVDGMLTGMPLDLTTYQHYWMGNLAVTLGIAALVLGMACVFEAEHDVH